MGQFWCTASNWRNAIQAEGSYRRIENAARELIELCSREEGIDDGSIEDHLVNSGLHPEITRRLLLLGPLGVSHGLQQRQGIDGPLRYSVHDKNKKPLTPTLPLVVEPAWIACWRWSREPQDQQALHRFAERTAYLRVVEDALRMGQEASSIAWEPVYIQLMDVETDSGSATVQLIGRAVSVVTLSPPARRMPAKRAWWKFWSRS